MTISKVSATWLLLFVLLNASASGLFAQTNAAATQQEYPHAQEPIGSVREIYDGTLSEGMAVNTFRNIDRLFPTRTAPASSHPRELPLADNGLGEVVELGEVVFQHDGQPHSLEDYLSINRVAGLLVLHDGKIKRELYRYGNTEHTRWMSMSVAKSITSTLTGAAIKQGFIKDINDPVTKYVPELADSAYDGATVRDVLMMCSGAQWNETYTDATSDRRALLEAQISQQPGSALAVMRQLSRAAEPGTVNNYNTGETQVAAEIVRGAVGKPLTDYLSERIWSRYGMEADANWWLESPDGIEIGGSGFSATLRDYGRFGQFLLEDGVAGGEQILPDRWLQQATTPKTLPDGETLEYGYLWWTGETPDSKRDKAYMAQGIHGQILYVNPAARVVIAVWGAQPQPLAGRIIDDWVFCDAVVRALAAE